MVTFLQELAQTIISTHINETEKLCIVLPNKRGAVFLKAHLAKLAQKTIWMPKIISAEELVSELSGLQQADSIDLICELYQSYQIVLGDKAEPFDAFAKWGNLMLQDFNEIDRYLVDYKSLYQNLKEIKEIENWSLSADVLTDTQQEYCEFMNQMGQIYEIYTQHLIHKKTAYQGLMYRKAVEMYKESAFINNFSKIIIAGFNALNKAETLIFSDLAKSGKAQLIWDADSYYLNSQDHEAGLFLRKNFSNPWLHQNINAANHFKTIPKHIEVFGVPKQVGQAMLVHDKINEWVSKGKALNTIAIVLADESLLFPVLNQLPAAVNHVNITMEYPLKYSPIFDLAESLINLQLSIQKNSSSKSFYFNDVFHVFQNSVFKVLYQLNESQTKLQDVISIIHKKNYVWFNESVFRELFVDSYSKIEFLFKPWQNSKDGIEAIKKIILALQNISDDSDIITSSDKEFLFVFAKHFNRLEDLIKTHSYLNSLQTLKSLFKQILGSSSVPFIGEPLQGLQIMGVLETRTLDFENIILLGVNEGVLPSGKTVNSFIPNDLKRFHGMPLYGDKDAIYSYHFYRLLQRAHQVVITYNIDQSTFGAGEKSRFITQLQFELKGYENKHQISEFILGGTISDEKHTSHISISKTDASLLGILNKITDSEQYGGLSPSALITYNHCSLKYFFRYGAGIKEPDNVEESIEANTQGTILHETLEAIYKPFEGKIVNESDLKEQMKFIQSHLNNSFNHYFSQRESEFGKNFLQKKVLYEYTKKLINHDIVFIQKLQQENQFLSIHALEHKLSAPIQISINGDLKTIYIIGSADRIDKIGSKIRIIDYKSSISSKDSFAFKSVNELFLNSKYDKQLQLFMYAWLLFKNNIATPENIEPSIIPFRMFKDEPQKIYVDKGNGRKGEQLIFTKQVMDEFENCLKEKIIDLFNRDFPFQQTTEIKHCEYCAYKLICNR
jgi:ATP-dependent helicase/nuclease subunit B